MSPEEIADALERSVEMAERALDAQIDFIFTEPDQHRPVFDALDRVLDELDDESLRGELRRELMRLEAGIEDIRVRVDQINTRAALDAVRVLAVDIRAELRGHGPAPQSELPL